MAGKATSLLYPRDRRNEHTGGPEATRGSGAPPEAAGNGGAPTSAAGRAGFLEDQAADDLGVKELASWLAHEGIATTEIAELLKDAPADAETIMYRQEILFDLYEHANLRKGLEQLIPKMQEVTVFARSTNEADSPFQQAVWRLGELELYVECLDELSRLFATDGAGVSAEGLCELRDTVEEERASEAFETLKRELPDMRKGLKNKRSVTIGVNLDQRLRPVEAALLSVNDTPYSEQRLLTGVMKALGGNSDFRVSTPLHRTPMAEEVGLPGSQKIPLSPLFQDLEQLLRSVSRNLLRSLERFMNMHTDILRTLHRDLGFYLGGCRLMERLSQEGLPVSRPRILDPAAAERPDSAGETNHAQTAKHAHVSQFYNIHLARRMMNRQHGAKQVVCNSLSMEDPRRIFILTGPNQGGKTTFVQGIGLLHVLIQSGLFAPAAEAYIRPVDRILTHFPHAEQGSTSTGRFSEELQRLSHMLRHVTGNSLLLLNESLASTNPVEASSVAQELIKALRTVGARAIFATHLHDLAHEIDRINAEVDATATVSHLRAEVAENGGDDGTATRTFRIVEGPPGGSSYARDIARRHGMSYDQIVQDFRKRGLLSD